MTEKLKSTYKELKELTSPEMNFQRYRQDVQAVHQTPCVPRLSKWEKIHIHIIIALIVEIIA